MKFIADQNNTEFGVPTVELTRRNLMALLTKLDDPASMRTIIDGERTIAIKAVEDEEHYADRPAGAMYMPTSGLIV